MSNMEKTRVKKGEKYWSVVYTSRDGFAAYAYADIDDDCDILDFERGNYFATQKEAEQMASKLHAVLAGADVIEMPSIKSIEDKAVDYNREHLGFPSFPMVQAFIGCADWLKSKIIK